MNFVRIKNTSNHPLPHTEIDPKTKKAVLTQPCMWNSDVFTFDPGQEKHMPENVAKFLAAHNSDLTIMDQLVEVIADGAGKAYAVKDGAPEALPKEDVYLAPPQKGMRGTK